MNGAMGKEEFPRGDKYVKAVNRLGGSSMTLHNSESRLSSRD